MVAGIQSVYALQIAHHKALEVPAVAQHVREQFSVAGGGDAVQRIVAGHDAKRPGFDGRLESGQHILLQVPGADNTGAAVVAAFRYAIGHEMLQGGNHAFRGGSTHQGRCHLAGQVHVFTVSFFHAGPARFARKVNHRSVADESAHGRELVADHLAHLSDQFRVPCGAEADGSGEHRSADGHMPVRRFFGQKDGNAQAGGVHGVALEGVVCLHGQLRVQAVLQGLAGPGIGPESAPEHAAVLFLDEFPVIVGDAHFIGSHLFVHGPAQRAQELPQLLLHGHAADQVVGPLIGRKGGIFIRLRCLFSAGHHHQRRGCGQKHFSRGHHSLILFFPFAGAAFVDGHGALHVGFGVIGFGG